MTENELYLNYVSNNRTVKQAGRDFIMRIVKGIKEKVCPLNFFTFFVVYSTFDSIGFDRDTSRPFAKLKEPFLNNARVKLIQNNNILFLYRKNLIQC